METPLWIIAFYFIGRAAYSTFKVYVGWEIRHYRYKSKMGPWSRLIEWLY